jgi:hypothetical protein
MFEVAFRLLQCPVPRHWLKQVELAKEFSACPRQGVSPRLLGNVLLYCSMAVLADGERDYFEALLREAIITHAEGYPAGSYVMRPYKEAVPAMLDGRFEECIELCEKAIVRGDEVGRPVLAHIGAIHTMFLPLLYLGRLERCLDLVREYTSAAGTPRPETVLLLALCYSQMGRIEEARTLAGPLIDQI